MNHKGLIVTLVIIIVLSGIVYFSLPKNNNGLAPTGTTTEESSTSASTAATETPSAQASNDQIIDFIVDDLAKEETRAAEASIQTTVPAAQSDAVGSINTNF